VVCDLLIGKVSWDIESNNYKLNFIKIKRVRVKVCPLNTSLRKKTRHRENIRQYICLTKN
jgi:hypothetical protein